ncbi:hypothetical protein OHB49_25190 [Streptomyces sp. NBC_01717]|uniref:hypothetical protein n=1 Tax=Streptomyces sp. NBC_01717 TaxID=2975918 RepID=UPI002E2F5253|nr:hypothetical protein [Streptomyces sp. NBC_01717]
MTEADAWNHICSLRAAKGATPPSGDGSSILDLRAGAGCHRHPDQPGREHRINPSDADLKKAEGVHINLWTGLAVLVLGLFFLLWLKLRPAPAPDGAADGGPDA